MVLITRFDAVNGVILGGSGHALPGLRDDGKPRGKPPENATSRSGVSCRFPAATGGTDGFLSPPACAMGNAFVRVRTPIRLAPTPTLRRGAHHGPGKVADGGRGPDPVHRIGALPAARAR